MSDEFSIPQRWKPRRKIRGMSAVLLPFSASGEIDWKAFEAHIERTATAGLVPAVNMDTGFAHLLTAGKRKEALRRTRTVLAGESFVAGVCVADAPGDSFCEEAYAAGIDEVQSFGGWPILFQSYGLTTGDDDSIIAAYERIATHCDRFLAFELGTMFAPFGAIYSLTCYERLMSIPQCIGAKHSSLHRIPEWQRLEMRDRVRPDFMVLTGNDLAIDMVMYGSDYLLGLSTFAPDWFAKRDGYWEAGDPRFYELNDVLQYLGCFAFRDPVPAYKHSAAMFLRQRGWIAHDGTHPNSPERPESDRQVLVGILTQLEALGK